MAGQRQDEDDDANIVVPYLAICPWDVERWENSSAYLAMTLGAQGAYRNLLDKAWKRQPTCAVPDDDRLLWRLAGARSIEEWWAVKAEVFSSDSWGLTSDGWVNEVVLETYQEACRRYIKGVRAGRVAGKASGRARRARAQAKRNKEDGTTVERSLNESRTKSNPPSPSPSPSPSTDIHTGRQTDRPAAAAANPLVDRTALVQEAYRLIPDIAAAEDLDPTEVARKASEYRGKSYVRIDVMPDDRLAHTVADLRSWHRRLTGKPEPTPKSPHPPPKPAPKSAAERVGDEWVREMEERLHGSRGVQGAVRGAVRGAGGVLEQGAPDRLLRGAESADGRGARSGDRRDLARPGTGAGEAAAAYPDVRRSEGSGPRSSARRGPAADATDTRASRGGPRDPGVQSGGSSGGEALGRDHPQRGGRSAPAAEPRVEADDDS